MRVLIRATGLIMLTLCAGCTNSETERTARQPAASAPSDAALPLPELCGAPQPAPQDPFLFNRTAAERDRIVRISDPAEYQRGGVAHFDGLDRVRLALLLQRRFIDPYERQNEAPNAWQIFQFMCSHPTVRAAGYVVSADRGDYRTSIEAIMSPTIDAPLRADTRTFCTDTDGLELDASMECYWD